MNSFICEWHGNINNLVGNSGKGRNKLRTYCTLKTQYCVESYCLKILPPLHRSAFCKFRCGVAPIRIETGRYENLELKDRKCPFCNVVETETHVILNCTLYSDIRNDLFQIALSVNPLFQNMSESEKFIFLFTHDALVRACAKTCYLILNRRNSYLCK